MLAEFNRACRRGTLNVPAFLTASALLFVAFIVHHGHADASETQTGAQIVSLNGCEGCHGAGFHGTVAAPALYGIEHHLTQAQIADAITHPKAPMPTFNFTRQQVSQIVSYLSGLDGGADATLPVVTITQSGDDAAVITVRFSGKTPANVTAMTTMQMGSQTMRGKTVTLHPSSNPNVFTGKLTFSMGGAWMVRIIYDGTHIDRPIDVGR